MSASGCGRACSPRRSPRTGHCFGHCLPFSCSANVNCARSLPPALQSVLLMARPGALDLWTLMGQGYKGTHRSWVSPVPYMLIAGPIRPATLGVFVEP